MTETSSKTASSLAITEKRPQRSNSCVGVFFQLFDWNRRLAKKKLFSKKLFPPVGAKRVSSKFGSDEKLPMAKLLIADENRGGFPSMKRTGKDSDAERSAMRKPGLVARLMGLESMPVVHRDKPKKAPNSDFYLNQGRTHVDNIQKASEFCCDHNLNSEKGLMKVGSRPQKLRKTGFFDRRTVAKVGAEALQFKNVFQQSRKQRHKLSSPAKSPRRLSGRKAARLVEAATRILEPGLHATNRARCSITYSASPCISLDDHAPIQGTAFSSKQTRQPTGPIGAKSLNVQSTCNSCGNFVGAVNFIPNVEEQITDFGSSSSELTSSELSNASSHGSENSMRSPKTSLEQDGDADGGRSVSPKCHRAVSLAAQAKSNLHRSTQNFMNEKPHIQRNQKLFSMARECRPQPVIASISSKQNNQKCNQMMPAKDRVHERTNLFSHHIRRDSPSNAVNRSKDYVASNRNLIHTTRRQTSTRVLDGAKMKMERSSLEKKDDSLSTVNNLARKRRPVNSSLHVENTGFANSTRGMQRSVTSDVIHRNGSAPFVRSVNHCSGNKAFPKKAEGNDARNSKDTDPAFFTFTSKKKQGTSSSSSEMKKQSKGEATCDSSHNKEAMLDANNESSSPLRRVTGFKGDALGALLEQKLKELTCLERDESVTGETLSGRSAAILQELISALSMSRPNSQVNGENCSDGLSSKGSVYSNSPVCSDCTHVQEMAHSPGSKFRTEAKEEGCLQFRPLAADCDHPSPTSILEASFSNDSYLSESPNYCSGHKLDNRSRLSHCQMQTQLHDPDLLDSATSINSRKVRIGTINNISSMLSIDTDEIGLTGVKLNYARDVIMNLELLFENLARYDADGIGADTLVDPLFLDMLEALAEHLRGSPRCSLGIPDVERNQLRGFLFDCMVESLDSRYSCYLESGFREWSKLPLSLSRGRLAGEIFEDIKKWRNLAGKDLDCIVEREMSNSFGKWTDFKPVVFDMGVEIERDILEILLDDMVMDLWQCSVGSV
ncbi:hypothetical protein MRB53_024019 [Persea americana]|uniref:Uncharacterized protein n=1 Tax=Persea americana TaxID=3435 RepID=A0ACC2LBW8_PERAE|nr:hypothetical protein MRB53_024019 [Persea americana]